MCDTLLLDGYNLLHRARGGFKAGPAPVVYNFFRGLRPIIEKFKPKEIIFGLEGKPSHRLALDANYKGNRVRLADLLAHDPKIKELLSFQKQAQECIELLQYMPITLLVHNNHECDDLLMNIAVQNAKQEKKCVIVSSDSDFTQVLQASDLIKLYNPIKKTFVKSTSYDYVVYKALVGDTSDNIKGVKGIGPARALKFVDAISTENFEGFDEYTQKQIKHNIAMIRCIVFDKSDWGNIKTLSKEETNWNQLRNRFASYKFTSIVSDKAWNKYIDTFTGLKQSSAA